MKPTFYALLKQSSLKLLLAILTFLIALYGFAIVVHSIFLDNEQRFDEQVFQLLSGIQSKQSINLMRFFSLFGKPEFLISAYLLLIIYFLARKRKRYAIETAIIASTSTLLLFLLKNFFARTRPELPVLKHLTNYSFPSGHALLTFVFCSLLIYFIWETPLKKSWQWTFSILLFIFSISVGISRIVLRMHFATDVIAGFCLGYSWVLTGLWIQHKVLNHKNHDPDNH